MKIKGAIEFSDLEKLISDMERLTGDIQEINNEAIKASAKVFERGIKASYTGNSAYIKASIMSYTKTSDKADLSSWGRVGVFHVDKIASSFGRTDKNLNAAQIAYWMEYGTRTLKGGGKKIKNMVYDSDQLILKQNSFISRAYYSTVQEQVKVAMDVFERHINKAI